MFIKTPHMDWRNEWKENQSWKLNRGTWTSWGLKCTNKWTWVLKLIVWLIQAVTVKRSDALNSTSCEGGWRLAERTTSMQTRSGWHAVWLRRFGWCAAVLSQTMLISDGFSFLTTFQKSVLNFSKGISFWVAIFRSSILNILRCWNHKREAAQRKEEVIILDLHDIIGPELREGSMEQFHTKHQCSEFGQVTPRGLTGVSASYFYHLFAHKESLWSVGGEKRAVCSHRVLWCSYLRWVNRIDFWNRFAELSSCRTGVLPFSFCCFSVCEWFYVELLQVKHKWKKLLFKRKNSDNCCKWLDFSHAAAEFALYLKCDV